MAKALFALERLKVLVLGDIARGYQCDQGIVVAPEPVATERLKDALHTLSRANPSNVAPEPVATNRLKTRLCLRSHLDIEIATGHLAAERLKCASAYVDHGSIIGSKRGDRD